MPEPQKEPQKAPQKGPHYIPELDPDGSAWKPGDGGVRVFWISFILCIAFFVGAVVAFWVGTIEIGIALVVLALIALVPLMLGDVVS